MTAERTLVAVTLLLAPAVAAACPACASAQRGGVSWLSAVLVLLPLVVAGAAALAIRKLLVDRP